MFTQPDHMLYNFLLGKKTAKLFTMIFGDKGKPIGIQVKYVEEIVDEGNFNLECNWQSMMKNIPGRSMHGSEP